MKSSIGITSAGCGGCPLKAQCTKAKGDREIKVSMKYWRLKSKAREKLRSEEGYTLSGFLCVKFKVDESNRLMFPGLVPRVCTMYQRFDTRSDAEKFKEKQSQILGKELFIGIHPKDGYVVYSTAQ